jgi:hypothetical protein
MTRNAWFVAGVACVLLGIVAITLDSVGFTRQETILDVGGLQVSAETRESIGLPVWLGAALIALGGVLSIVGVTKRAG